MYKKVNQKFADAVLEELPSKTRSCSYRITILPCAKMIKVKQPNATIALFWHIPWPKPRYSPHALTKADTRRHVGL
jgi:trehalose 6-phosphate synthase